MSLMFRFFLLDELLCQKTNPTFLSDLGSNFAILNNKKFTLKKLNRTF